jgi:thiol:disulfide interchange protein DsbD
MPDTLVTAFQIFAIGFSFSLAGPCFLTCTPILLTYVVATDKKWPKVLSNIFIFLSGRLLAYLILGWLAGLSAEVLNRFLSSNYSLILRPLGGLISIVLGVFILFAKESDNFFCRLSQNQTVGSGNIFVLGFIVGISPCGPLIALLFEIALIAKTGLGGLFYASSFGLGACLASLIIIAVLAGLLKGLSIKFFSSKRSNAILKTTCALLLILLGINIFMSSIILR